MDIYNRVLLLVITVLVVISGVLVFLNADVHLHIRNFELIGDANAADISQQRIQIQFNRPLAEQEDWQNLVSVQPEASTRYIARGDQLFIYFEETLIAGQAYTIVLDKRIKDVYGEPLEKTTKIDFTTRPLRLYSISDNQINQYKAPDFAPKNYYTSDSRISDYDVSGRHLAVVEAVDDSAELANSIHTLRLVEFNNEGEVIKQQLLTNPETENVYTVQFVSSQQALYFIKEKIKYVDNFPVSDGGRKLFVHVLAANQTRQIDLPPQLGIEDVDQFQVAEDGRAVMIRDSLNAEYYLLDTNNIDNSLPLGRYVDTGGLNFDNNKVIFTKLNAVGDVLEPYTVAVNNKGEEILLTPEGVYTIDPQFAANDDSIVFARRYKQLEQTRGLFEVVIQDAKGVELDVLRKKNFSLELPKPSPDDHYVVMEKYTPQQLRDFQNLRVIGYQAKPNTAELVIYDTINKEKVKNIPNAISAKWGS